MISTNELCVLRGGPNIIRGVKISPASMQALVGNGGRFPGIGGRFHRNMHRVQDMQEVLYQAGIKSQ